MTPHCLRTRLKPVLPQFRLRINIPFLTNRDGRTVEFAGLMPVQAESALRDDRFTMPAKLTVPVRARDDQDSRTQSAAAGLCDLRDRGGSVPRRNRLANRRLPLVAVRGLTQKPGRSRRFVDDSPSARATPTKTVAEHVTRFWERWQTRISPVSHQQPWPERS